MAAKAATQARSLSEARVIASSESLVSAALRTAIAMQVAPHHGLAWVEA
jgi:hypothetical protein